MKSAQILLFCIGLSALHARSDVVSACFLDANRPTHRMTWSAADAMNFTFGDKTTSVTPPFDATYTLPEYFRLADHTNRRTDTRVVNAAAGPPPPGAYGLSGTSDAWKWVFKNGRRTREEEGGDSCNTSVIVVP